MYLAEILFKFIVIVGSLTVALVVAKAVIPRLILVAAEAISEVRKAIKKARDKIGRS